MGDREYCYTVNDRDPVGGWEFPEEQRLCGEDWDLVATDLAEDYFLNHDGWEAIWPLDLRIFRDGVLVGDFEIEMEHRPSFSTFTNRVNTEATP